jgi:transcriptional regulator with GAF, ATPase, and Fis domain
MQSTGDCLIRSGYAMAGHLVSGVVILICQKLVKRGCHFQLRELQNVIRRAALVAGGGLIEPEHLALRERSVGLLTECEPNGDKSRTPASASAPVAGAASPIVTLDELVRTHIGRTLETTGDRIYGEGGATKLLGVKPTTLQSRMVKLGIRH